MNSNQQYLHYFQVLPSVPYIEEQFEEKKEVAISFLSFKSKDFNEAEEVNFSGANFNNREQKYQFEEQIWKHENDVHILVKFLTYFYGFYQSKLSLEQKFYESNKSFDEKAQQPKQKNFSLTGWFKSKVIQDKGKNERKLQKKEMLKMEKVIVGIEKRQELSKSVHVQSNQKDKHIISTSRWLKCLGNKNKIQNITDLNLLQYEQFPPEKQENQLSENIKNIKELYKREGFDSIWTQQLELLVQAQGATLEAKLNSKKNKKLLIGLVREAEMMLKVKAINLEELEKEYMPRFGLPPNLKLKFEQVEDNC